MLTKEFIAICKEYAQKCDNVLGQELDDGKKICKYRIIYYSYILEFRYVKKEHAFYKTSSLYCVIYLRKNSVVHYHLTDIIPFLERKTFQSCFFWNIESPERLQHCFNSLTNTVNTVTSQLGSEDTFLLNELLRSYKEMYNMKENDIDFSKIDDPREYAQTFFKSLQETRDGIVFSRFSNFAPYTLLCRNKFDKAFQRYEKLRHKNKILPYEKALIEHIQSSGMTEFCPFAPGCDTSVSAKLLTPLVLIKAFAYCFIPSSVFFCGIFAIYKLIISASTLAVLCAPWYNGFLLAGLCSVFGMLALAAYKPPANKYLSEKERKDLAKVMTSTGTRRFIFIVCVLIILVSFVLTASILACNVRFYEDAIRFEGQSYTYEQIDSVYYIDARYNFEGDRIERPSYVILFDDQTSLDLDGYGSVSETEKEILPLLEGKGISVMLADSERDLPWYTDSE